MDDKDIIALFWARAEEAITQTAKKYANYCHTIISRILPSPEDIEECLNDTYLGAWNAMPPQRPAVLPPLLGRIARNAALDRYDYSRAKKRSAAFEMVLDELNDCTGGDTTQSAVDCVLLGEAIGRFLSHLSPVQRQVFLRRYWYCDSLEEIAARYGFTVSKVKSMLHRSRRGLKEYLIKEGYSL